MKTVAAAIIIKNGRILLGKRHSQAQLGGYWEFPGGKLEDGESVHECIEREILEELGVRSKAEAQIFDHVHTYDFGRIKLICVRAHLLESKLHCKVHEQLKWVPMRELGNYNLAPADIPVATYLMHEYA